MIIILRMRTLLYNIRLLLLLLLMGGSMQGAMATPEDFDPTPPGEPGDVVKSRLYLESDPVGGCTFNITSGTAYKVGSSVLVKATAMADYYFVGWYQSDIKVGEEMTYTVASMPYHDMTLTAKFEYRPLAQYVVAVSSADALAGTVTGGGTYKVGSNITIKATPKSSAYKFAYWSRNGQKTDLPQTCTFVLEDGVGNLNFEAHFDYEPLNPGEPGVLPITSYLFLKSEPANACTFNLTSGTGVTVGSSVVVRATALAGYEFAGWYQGELLVSSVPSYTVSSMPYSDLTLTARFVTLPVPNKYVVSVSAADALAGTVTGGGTYSVGDVVSLSATPKSSLYHFDYWTKNGVKTDLPQRFSFTLADEDGNLDFMAYFEYDPTNPSEPAMDPNQPTESQAVYGEACAGYVVEFDPFHLDAEGETTVGVRFKVAETSVQIKQIEFDLQLDSKWYDNGIVASVAKNSSLNTQSYTVPDPIERGDGSFHFTLVAKSEDCYFGNVTSTQVGYFTLRQKGEGVNGSYSIADGIYQITIDNVMAKGVDGMVYMPDPFVGDIYVGLTKAVIDNGAVAFRGNYSSEASFALLAAALPADDELTTIDLTCVSAVPEGAMLTAQNKNALIITKQDLGLANTQNVVIGNECENLVLVDGCSFAAPIEFTAATVSHARVGQTSKWGTVCLPYALSSDDKIQYYELESVTSDRMSFAPVATVDAGVPVMFRRLADAQFSANATNVVIQKTVETYQTTTTANPEWKMLGFYRACKVIESELGGQLYYISSDSFKGVASEATVKAFKALYLYSGSAASAPTRFSIEEIESETSITELEDGRVELRAFDLNGRRQNEVNQGIQLVSDKLILLR